MAKIEICREPEYYTTGYKGNNPSQAPFYLSSLLFDEEKGELTKHLIEKFNNWLDEKNISDDCKLIQEGIKEIPDNVIIINASSDDLPTSYETKRIFKAVAESKNWNMELLVVNEKERLLKEINERNNLLVVSQCVKKHVYDKKLASELENKGIAVVPGKLTAPGSIFSDKARTYKLLSGNSETEKMVACFEKIESKKRTIPEVVEEILNTVDYLESELEKNKFFIKPIEGGGGLGGFRLMKLGRKYVIPDLSRVTGITDIISPSYMNIDLQDEKRIRELFWIYNLFEQNKKLNSNYIEVNIEGRNKEKKFENFKKYLKECKCKQHEKYEQIATSRAKTKNNLIEAIQKFENKFNRRYIPLVNEHIDFGSWGLRAHYRFSTEGPVLETIYSRIFQLAFTPEGVGYVGADNISNKQTGELEIERLGPINKIMLESVGGEKRLYEILYKGVKTMNKLVGLQDEKNRNRVPFRLQLDLAAVSGLIGEVNADTARGLCLASPWDIFLKNTSEWFIDSIKYYSWRCKNANL